MYKNALPCWCGTLRFFGRGACMTSSGWSRFSCCILIGVRWRSLSTQRLPTRMPMALTGTAPSPHGCLPESSSYKYSHSESDELTQSHPLRFINSDTDLFGSVDVSAQEGTHFAMPLPTRVMADAHRCSEPVPGQLSIPLPSSSIICSAPC